MYFRTRLPGSVKYLLTMLALSCGLLSSTLANVRLAKVFSDSMVLQRNMKVPVWGWADKGEKVTVIFNGQEKTATTNQYNEWKVTLDPMKAGGPFEMKVSGDNDIIFEEVLIGEVWICSGQSNMEWTLARSKDSTYEIEHANYPNIRLFSAPHTVNYHPADTLDDGHWVTCNPHNIEGFSAVAYFFGREIHKELNVPVGLLKTAWGGTNVQTWTSMDAIKNIDDFAPAVKQLQNKSMEEEKAEFRRKYDSIIESFNDKDVGLKDGKAHWAIPDMNEDDWNVMDLPGYWEKKGLNGVDGVIWFRKTIEVPAEMAKNAAVLKLGVIDDSDKTWVNGQKVGEMFNAYNKFRHYNIKAGVLKPGKNVIAVRVEDYRINGGFVGPAEKMCLKSGDEIIKLAGTWKYKISPVDFKVRPPQMISPNIYPTLLFNAMINPLIPYAMKGVIWYQGEANAGDAYNYRTYFPAMIKDWRDHWGQGQFPFLFVQLANFMKPSPVPSESSWAELREAQFMALDLPNTGMAVTIDVGEENSIHPINKQDVGYRLALAARNIAYDENIVYAGPLYKQMEKEGDKIRIYFDNADVGLVAIGGKLNEFSIAGPDKIFKWADAVIDGNTVQVSNPDIDNPVAVRYGWADNPVDANLYNCKGLPASPFRTDNWKGVTWKE